jgi:hypothetical protein
MKIINVAKKEAKKVVREAKCKTYDELYSKLGGGGMNDEKINIINWLRLGK